MSSDLGARLRSPREGLSQSASAGGTVHSRDFSRSEHGPVPLPILEHYSPEPILSAAEAFQGSWVDLDHSLSIHAPAFARGWKGLSSTLRRCGLDAGDRVIMAVGNGPLFPAALVAILRCGGSPLLVHCETPSAELRRTAARFAARFILCDWRQESDLLSISSRVHTVTSEDWLRLLWAELPEASGQGSHRAAGLAGVPLHPTSGTTGHPRIAARPGAAPWPRRATGFSRWGSTRAILY